MKILLIIGLVLFLGGILFPLFNYFKEVKKEDNKIEKNKRSNKEKKVSKGNNFDGKFDKDINVIDSRNLLEFDEILVCNEEEAILKISDNEYVAYLEVGGVSYNLLSIEEKLSLEEAYGTLLNGIDFEFQKYIQSRSLNLDNYINKYQARIDELEEKSNIMKQKIGLANNEDERSEIKVEFEKIQNQLKYAYLLIDDFKRKYIDSNLLERRYYIVVKYFHDPSEYKDLSDFEILKTAYSNLYNKLSIFIDTFQRINMSCKFLDAMGIAELQYSSFNKEESNILKLENVIKSKYNHLCVTATPIYAKEILEEKKKIEKEQKELEKEIKEKAEELVNMMEMEVTK